MFKSLDDDGLADGQRGGGSEWELKDSTTRRIECTDTGGRGGVLYIGKPDMHSACAYSLS